jgi:predicted GNAT family acetyltransferase
MLTLTVYSAAQPFLQVTEQELLREEAANNLMLGLAKRLAAATEPIEPRPFFATVKDEQGLVLAAVITPPYPLTLFRPREAGNEPYQLVAQHLLAEHWPLRAVSARVPASLEFAQVWAVLTGGRYNIQTRERVYILRQVIPAPPTPGRMRVATEADLELVAQWSYEFITEALPSDDPAQLRATVPGRVARGNVFLWEDGGRAVSMAGRARPALNGIVVNLVYTPPELRGRGYATACVAALSQRLLDEGWQFCALFTDLANPTSNSIYQKIGYQPVCDFDVYDLMRTEQV